MSAFDDLVMSRVKHSRIESKPKPDEPGMIEASLYNLLGSTEGAAGSKLTGAGVFFNATRPQRMENLASIAEEYGMADNAASIREQAKTAPDNYDAINTGQWLSNKAAEIDRKYGAREKYKQRDLLDLATDPEFWTDPRGAAAWVANGVGSSLDFAVLAALAPEVGLPTKALQIASKAPGLGKAAAALIDRGAGTALDKTLVGGLLNTPMDAYMNAAEIYQPLQEQGYTQQQIWDRMNSAAAEEMPYDLANNILMGGVLTGQLGKVISGNNAGRIRRGAGGAASGLLDMASEGAQEVKQTQTTNKYSNRPYGSMLDLLPGRTLRPEEQEAFNAGFFGGGPFAIGGTIRDVISPARDDIAPVVDEGNTPAPSQGSEGSADGQAPYTPSAWNGVGRPAEREYTISDQVSSTDITELTDTKMRLLDRDYYNKFGRHLFVTSMKRSGDPNASWHNTGQAFDTADELLESDTEAREWLMEQGRKYGLTPLDEYANPSPHATGGHIHFSDHGEEIPGNVGGAAPSGKREGHANAWAVYDVFRAAGFNDNAIAGILGRLQQEHNFSTDMAEEYDEPGIGRVGGLGMFQWQMDPAHGGRGNSFMAWAQQQGLDPYNATVQAQYALKEAMERGITPERMNKLSAEDAADLWTKEWEVGKPGSERQYANEWLARIKEGGSAGSASPASTPGATSSTQAQEIDEGSEQSFYDDLAKQWLNASRQGDAVDLFEGLPSEGKDAMLEMARDIQQTNQEGLTPEQQADFVNSMEDMIRDGDIAGIAKMFPEETARTLARERLAPGKKGRVEAPKIDTNTENLDAAQEQRGEQNIPAPRQQEKAQANLAQNQAQEQPAQSNGQRRRIDDLVFDVLPENEHGMGKAKRAIQRAAELGYTAVEGENAIESPDGTRYYMSAKGVMDFRKAQEKANTMPQNAQPAPANAQQQQGEATAQQQQAQENAQQQSATASQENGNALRAALAPVARLQEGRMQQAGAIREAAKAANVEIPKAMLPSLESGSVKAIKAAQDVLRQAGIAPQGQDIQQGAAPASHNAAQQQDSRNEVQKAVEGIREAVEDVRRGEIIPQEGIHEVNKIARDFAAAHADSKDAVDVVNKERDKAVNEILAMEQQPTEVQDAAPEATQSQSAEEQPAAEEAQNGGGGKSAQNQAPKMEATVKAEEAAAAPDEAVDSLFHKSPDPQGRQESKLARASRAAKAVMELLKKSGIKVITNEAELTKAGIGIGSSKDSTIFGRMGAASVREKTIFIDVDHLDEILQTEIPIHEYTHIWDSIVAERNPELWKRGIELMKQTREWGAVKRAYLNGGINYIEDENALATEVHARLVENHGSTLFMDNNGSSNLIQQLKAWAKEYWQKVKSMLAPWTTNEAKNMSLEDFVNAPLADLISGTNLAEEPAQKEDRKSESVEKYINERHKDRAPEIRKALYREMEVWDDEQKKHKKITVAQFFEEFAETPGARVYYKPPRAGLGGDNGSYVYQNDAMREKNYEPTVNPLVYDYLKYLLGNNAQEAEDGTYRYQEPEAAQADKKQGEAKPEPNSTKQYNILQKLAPIPVEEGIAHAPDGKSGIQAAVEAFSAEYPNGATPNTAVGKVKVDRKGLKNSLSHLQYAAKYDTVVSLPEGLEIAAYMDSVPDINGKDITNHFLVYPIRYKGERQYVVCRIRETLGGRSFYIHGVYTTEDIEKKIDALSQTRPPSDGKVQPGGTNLYDSIIAKFFSLGKKEEEKTKDPSVPPAQAAQEDNGIPAIDGSSLASNIPQEQGEVKESIFGSIEDADREMYEALGITPEDAENEELSFTNEFGDTTDEEIEALKDELRKELSKLSANPVFNPRIYSLGLQIGGKYIQKGYRTFKKWMGKMRSDFGEQIEPWAPAIWETLRTYPSGEKFDPKQAIAVARAIGARYERGAASLDEIQKDITKNMSEKHRKTFAPLIKASYNGIKRFFDEREAAANGKADERGQGAGEGSARGHRDVERGGRGAAQEERQETSGEPAREHRGDEPGEGKGHGRDNTPADGASRNAERGRDQQGQGGDDSAGNGAGGAKPPVLAESAAIEEAVKENPAKDGERPAETPGHNYRIADSDKIGEGGEKTKFKQNIDAVTLLKKLEAEGRRATPAEQAILAKFNGWGTVKSAFSNDPKWAKEHDELKALLTDEEYKEAAAASLNAFYTSPEVVKAIWEGVQRIGFKGGRVLDPSMGSGNFFGLMPQDVMEASTLHGVEKDSLTGRLARQLYQKADVQVTGFEKTKLPNNYFDLAISNVPFGETVLHDPEYEKTSTGERAGYRIHNYFFAKAMDKVRPGGLVVFITGPGTMQTTSPEARLLRAEMDRKADLVAAFKLPGNAFQKNAGTSVTTDILILQKRENPSKKAKYAQLWNIVDMLKVERGPGLGADYFNINSYYLAHPENMLGKPVADKLYGGRDRMGLDGKGVDVEKELSSRMAKLPKDIYAPAKAKEHSTVESTKKFLADPGTVENAYAMKDGKPYQNIGGELQPVPASKAGKVAEFCRLRGALNALLRAQIDPAASDKVLEKLRKELNAAYDTFAKKHGYVNAKKNMSALADDPLYGSVAAIEKYKYDKKTKKESAEKTDIFSKRTVGAIQDITTAETATDALTASLSQRGRVDIPYMANLLGRSEKDTIEALGDMLYENPATGRQELAEEYLSGNVREKLALAETAARANPAYKRNVDALSKVQPAKYTERDVKANIGAPWIPANVYTLFTQHMVGGAYGVTHDPLTNAWKLRPPERSRYYGTGVDPVKLSRTWGTPEMPFNELLEKILGMKDIEVKKEDADGNKVIDRNATAAAIAKAEEIQAEFEKWLWADEDRKEILLNSYNKMFNSEVERNYDGSALTLPGLALQVQEKLYPHQKNAIWRMMHGGNTLIAHCVGAGKTWEMVCAGMEMKRVGICRKPLYAVPNNVVEQFRKEFLQAYPNAKLLVLTAKDLPGAKLGGGAETFTEKLDTLKHKAPRKFGEKKGEKGGKARKESAEQKRDRLARRRAALSRIATEDWDGIIISHNLFANLPMSPEYYQEFYQEQADELEAAIRQAKEGNLSKRDTTALQNALENLKNRLERNVEEDKKEVAIPFEELGVDQIFVDEADKFKNLAFHTGMGRLSGISTSNAKRSTDMYVKTRYMAKAYGRGIVFATGTPISNSMNEMFTMQRYLAWDKLKDLGMNHFDAWASMFGRKTEESEPSPDGNGFRMTTKLKFTNLKALGKMFRSFADIKLAEDLPYLKRPRLKGGERTVVSVEASDAFNRLKKELLERADAIRQGSPKKRTKKNGDEYDDNMLAVTNDFRTASLDMRLIDPSISAGEAGAKIEALCDTVFRKYRETEAAKGAQVIFSDIGTPKAEKATESESADGESIALEIDQATASVYQSIKDGLIKRGIPAEEIAFVHDGKNNEQRQALFERVNNGEIRVFLGSTETMGAGTNFQKHLAALHHLDCPWKPRDVEQREGRILRQGNDNEEVEIFTYVTKGSYDANMWDKVRYKQHMIDSVMRGDPAADEMEDVSSNGSAGYGEIEAIAMENPLMAEKVNVDADVMRLRSLESTYRKEQRNMRSELDRLPARIWQERENAKRAEADIKDRVSTKGDAFKMKLGGKTYTKRADAEKALAAIDSAFTKDASTKIGEVGGFEIHMRHEKKYIENKGNGEVVHGRNIIQLVNHGSYTAENSIQSIEHAVNNAPEKALAAATKAAETMEARQKGLEEETQRPFKQQDELDEAVKRQQEIQQQLEEAQKQKDKEAQDESTESTEAAAEEAPGAADQNQGTEPRYAQEEEVDEPQSTSGQESPSTGETANFTTGDFRHTKTGEMMPQAKLKSRVDTDTYKKLSALARNYGGGYSRFAKTFLFRDGAKRDEFVKAADALLASYDPDTMAKLSITAWHGSPHKFDKFLLDHIGTGEGNQVHGWGLYFAKMREVSEGYREWLTGGATSVSINGERFIRSLNRWVLDDGNYESESYEIDSAEGTALEELEKANWDVAKAIDALNDDSVYYPAFAAKAIAFLQNNSFEVLEQPGSLFQVEIPDEDVMLDEQKNLSEQPEKVRKALREIGIFNETEESFLRDVEKLGGEKAAALVKRMLGDKSERVDTEKAQRNWDELIALVGGEDKMDLNRLYDVEYEEREKGLTSGREIYESLADREGSGEEASKLLNQHGIKGITYEGGRDGRCYVVFDDQAIDIIAQFSAENLSNDAICKLIAKAEVVEGSSLTSQQRKLSALGEELGSPVVWMDADSRVNGWHQGGVTFLNVNSKQSMEQTFWHETLHWMKENNPEAFGELLDAMQEQTPITEAQIAKWKEKTGRKGLSSDEVRVEMLCDSFSDAATRVKELRSLANNNPSLAARAIAWLKRIMDRFIEAMHGPSGRLTTAQRDNMVRVLGKIASTMKDGEGRPLFHVYQGGREIRMANGQFLPAVSPAAAFSATGNESGKNSEKGVDKEGKKLDNRIREIDAEARNNQITRTIVGKFNEEVQKLVDDGWTEAQIQRLLSTENSFLQKEIVKPWAKEYNQFHAKDIDKKGILNRIFNDEHACDGADYHQIDRVFDVFKDRIERMMDDANMVYAECANARRGGQAPVGFDSWKDVEQSIKAHGGQTGFKARPKPKASANLNSNQSSTRTNAGASSMPKFSANLNEGEAERSFLDRVFERFGKSAGVKAGKIIAEERGKDPNSMGIIDYLAASPSRIAGKVAMFRQFFRMGDSAMNTLTKNRSDFARKMEQALGFVKSKEEKENLYSILLAGDAEGKEYTQQQLMDEEGVSEGVAKAYSRIRGLLAKAHKMVDEAKRRPQMHSKNVTQQELDELKANKFVEIKSESEADGDGKRLVSWKEYANWEKTYTVTEATLARFRADEAMQVLDVQPSGNSYYEVRVRESVPPVGKRKGYIPHFFHDFMVAVKGENGEIVANIGSGRTQAEAIAKAEEWMKENGMAEGQQIYISPKVFDFTSLGMDESQYAVVMGDKDFDHMMESIAEHNDITLAEAKKLMEGSVKKKNRHRFLGNLLHRQGVEGYETNLDWVLRHYFNSASRYAALETEFKPQAISLFERYFGDFNKDHTGLAQYTKDYINDVNGNPSALEKAINDTLNRSDVWRRLVASSFGDRAALQFSSTVTNWTSMLCLGYLNASSAILNFTQAINAAGYLGSASAAARIFKHGFKRKYGYRDMRVLIETNVMNDIGLDSGSGYDTNRGYAGKAFGTLGKISQKGMILFKLSEGAMRRGTVLAAYEKAIADGKTHAQAIAYAKDINRKSNFDYGIADAPNVFRRGSILSQLALQFKKYTFKELEVMGDMLPMLGKSTNRKQKMLFWGMYFLAVGLLQVPGIDWLDKLLGEDMKDFAQKSIMEACGDSAIGKAIGRAAMYGLPSLAGVDISNRAGMADVVPTKASDLAGPAFSRTVSLASDIAKLDGAAAIRDISPGLYNQYAAWIAGESTGGRGRVNTRYDTIFSKLLKSIGFKSTDERVASDIQRITYNERSRLTDEKQAAIDAYLADETTENAKRLKELGIKPETVKKERERKKADRLQRAKAGLSKAEQKQYEKLYRFAE